MCTAIVYGEGDGYFGRNLDLEYSYNECVAITPRRYPLIFRRLPALKEHHALVGIATVVDGHPLYYDAMNEKGLAMAALNFPESGWYAPDREGAPASFEVLPWVLGQCTTVDEAKQLLTGVVITDAAFSDRYPPTPLHWMITDGVRSLVIEPLREGVRLHENPVGVLTNEPPFEAQLLGLRAHASLSAQPPHNRLAPPLDLHPFSKGMGAMGLPGDLSSPSRFVRAAFVKWNAVSGPTEEERVAQFFHLLGAVAQPRGCNHTAQGYEITRYASCCNLKQGLYYYATYDGNRVVGVDLHREALDGTQAITYPLLERLPIFLQNSNNVSVVKSSPL